MIQGLVRLYWRWRARSARHTLSHFDELQKKAGRSRTERRQFWREFIRTNAGIITERKD
jgi:hypothetical protein